MIRQNSLTGKNHSPSGDRSPTQVNPQVFQCGCFIVRDKSGLSFGVQLGDLVSVRFMPGVRPGKLGVILTPDGFTLYFFTRETGPGQTIGEVETITRDGTKLEVIKSLSNK